MFGKQAREAKQAELERLTALPVAERAAEMLPVLVGVLTDGGRAVTAMYLMDQCFGIHGLPAANDDTFAGNVAVSEGLQALVTTGMLIRIETDFAGPRANYWPSAAATAAIQQGTALAEITRRLPS